MRNEIEVAATANRRAKHRWLAMTAAVGFAVAAIGVNAAAQSQADGKPTKKKQEDQQQQEQDQEPDQQKQESQQRDWRIEPDAWVAVGYDIDGDGVYELVEYVFGYDLLRARQASDQRADAEGRDRKQASKQEQSKQAQQKGKSKARQASSGSAEKARRGGTSSSRPAVFRVEGRIRSMENVQLVGLDEPHVMATLTTGDERSARVELGLRSALDELDLEQNDSIEVIGSIGKVDGKALLVADRIRIGDQTFEVERPDDMDLQRMEGTLRATRKVKYKGMDTEHMQARVELSDDRTVLVDLGPVKKLGDLELSEGTSIRFLADNVRIGDEEAFRAERIRVRGTTVNLDRSWEREKYKRKNDW